MDIDMKLDFSSTRRYKTPVSFKTGRGNKTTSQAPQ